jgi:hypothetical protein
VHWHYAPDGTIKGHEYREGYPVQTGKILVHDRLMGLARDVHHRVYTLAQPGHKERDKEIAELLARYGEDARIRTELLETARDLHMSGALTDEDLARAIAEKRS